MCFSKELCYLYITLRAVHGGELGLYLEEMAVHESSSLAGKTLMDSGIRRDHDLIVVAIKRTQGEMMFNPNPGTLINAFDILVVLGNQDNIKALEKKL